MWVRFRGKRYNVRILDTWRGRDVKNSQTGHCTSPLEKNRKIFLKPTRTAKERFETAIHESIHACHWDLHEDAVSETARNITSYAFELFEIKPRPEVWGDH